MDYKINLDKPIFYEFNFKKVPLEFKITKGKIKNFKIIRGDDNSLLELYTEAKNLQPIEGIPIPKNNIYTILYGAYLVSSSSKYDYTNLPEELKNNLTKNIDSKIRETVILYDSITGIKPFLDHEFFNRFINNNKSYKTLYIFNSLTISTLEEYIIFREKNSKKSYLDSTYALEIPFFLSEERAETEKEKRKKIMKVFSKVDYNISRDNLCDFEKMLPILDILPDEFDFIDVKSLIYLYKVKEINSYINSQMYLNLIFLCLKKLKPGGLLKFQVGELNNILTSNILTLLNSFFSKIMVFKSSIDHIITPWKSIVCVNYIGKKEIIFEEIIKVIKKWNSLDSSCGLNLTSYNKEKDDYLIKFLKNDENIEELQNFNNIESYRKKIVFTDIISTYYSLKYLDRERIFQNVYEKNLAKTLNFLRVNNINEKIPYKNNDNKILEEDFLINFDKDRVGILNYRDSKELKIKIIPGEYNTEELYNLDNNLKFTKRLLDTFDLSLYKEVSFVRKKLEGLKNYINNDFEVSQAFIKFSEVLSEFDLIDSKKDTLKAFHFCEAPGQFILATQEYIKNHTTISNYDWKAQSLNPRKVKEAFGDDYGLISKNRKRWDFGEDDTGDITKTSNIKHYKKIVSESNLITSDCGSNMRNPTSAIYQDKELSFINFCQILLVLNGITKGSHYVAKIFLPQTHPFIIGMNYILTKSFEKIYFHKSYVNQGSSEVYMICKNFIHLDTDVIKNLFAIKNNFSNSKIFIRIPYPFLEEYTRVLRIYLLRHINHIKMNIYYYKYPENLIRYSKKIQSIKNKNIKNWLKKYKF